MKYILVLFAAVLLIVMASVSVAAWLDCKTNCTDYLKLAGDAPTIELTDSYLTHAIVWIETHGRTSGNSAILFRTPSNDLAIWYNQLKNAQITTKSLILSSEPVSQLTKDNALMKIREVVLDNSADGTCVTTPDNLQVYPYQGLFVIAWIFTVLICIVIFLVVFIL